MQKSTGDRSEVPISKLDDNGVLTTTLHTTCIQCASVNQMYS